MPKIQTSKYQRWYKSLCDKARDRIIPKVYTEVHHVKPRSLGGSDHPSNLVRFTYREHYLAHWLLTKIHTGRDLQKMQRALWAMTLKANGERIASGWQVEAAKRAVRDMELEDDDAGYLERYRQRKQDKIDAHHANERAKIRQWNEKDFVEMLWHASLGKDPWRSTFRAEILATFKKKPEIEFDHQLIAKYFDASPEEIKEAREIHMWGERRYKMIKHDRARGVR